MHLQPKRPPGRADRKAAAYAAEILRLRAEGYTYEAIREALAEVDIQLSESALRREVRRSRKLALPIAAVQEAPAPPDPRTKSSARPQATGPPSSQDKSGRDIAQAFFDAHPGNPLFPIKDTP